MSYANKPNGSYEQINLKGAESFEESKQRAVGGILINKPTTSSEKLYRTQSGSWVLQKGRLGTKSELEVVSPKDAIGWLTLNGHEIPDDWNDTKR